MNKGNNHKNAAIHLAAQNGWTKVMEILLKAKNINVNFKDLHANTALHLAAQNGQIGVRVLCQLLLFLNQKYVYNVFQCRITYLTKSRFLSR